MSYQDSGQPEMGGTRGLCKLAVHGVNKGHEEPCEARVSSTVL